MLSMSKTFNQTSFRSIQNSPNNSSNYPPKFQKKLLLKQEIKKEYLPGTNESGMFAEIIKKEMIKPYDKSKESYLRRNHSEINFSNKWALQTTKLCSSPERIPKIQPFKNYHFPSVSNEDKEKYQKSFADTDNITIKCPKEKFLKTGPNLFLEMKRMIFS